MTKKIEIVTTVASLIEPGKKYLLQVDKHSVSMKEAQQIVDKLEEWAAEGILVLYDEKPLKITEVK